MAALLRDHKRFMTDIEIEFDVRTGKDRDRNIVATWQSPKIAEVTAQTASVKAAVRRKKSDDFAQDQPTML